MLGRPGCHLCEDFLADLMAAFPKLEGRVTQVNVDDNQVWHMVYGVRIPVLLDPQGFVLAEGHVKPGELREVLADC